MKSRFLTGLAVAALAVSFSGCAHHVKGVARTPEPLRNEIPSQPAPRQADVARTTETTAAAPATQSGMPDAATRARIQDLLDRIQDAYFDYNKHSLRPDATAALQKDSQTLADIIRQYPDFKLNVEGHCDERGSEEYNLALGDARAKQAKEYLATLGLPGAQLRTISYGKDKPACTDHDEECWQKNRRAHLTQEQ